MALRPVPKKKPAAPLKPLPKKRTPLQQKALTQAIRRTLVKQPRFADNGGIEKGVERRNFQNAIQKKFNQYQNSYLPQGSDLQERYRNRVDFLRMPPAKQQAQQEAFQQQKADRAEEQRRAAEDIRQRRDMQRYLGTDETYQNQDAMFDKAWEDYLLSFEKQQGRVGEDFDLATDRMSDERVRARDIMTEDAGSRGIIRSGIFADSLSDYDTEYQQRLGDLSRDRDRTLEDLLEQRRLFQTENEMRRQEARMEAIRRMAAEEGIGLSDVVDDELWEDTDPTPNGPGKKNPRPAGFNPNLPTGPRVAAPSTLNNKALNTAIRRNILENRFNGKDYGDLNAKQKDLLANLVADQSAIARKNNDIARPQVEKSYNQILKEIKKPSTPAPKKPAVKKPAPKKPAPKKPAPKKPVAKKKK